MVDVTPNNDGTTLLARLSAYLQLLRSLRCHIRIIETGMPSNLFTTLTKKFETVPSQGQTNADLTTPAAEYLLRN